jgi:hypothetical protein
LILIDELRELVRPAPLVIKEAVQRDMRFLRSALEAERGHTLQEIFVSLLWRDGFRVIPQPKSWLRQVTQPGSPKHGSRRPGVRGTLAGRARDAAFRS